ncbi:MAG: hypothetical protein A2144_07730 [Chloroflexi bacterium RBG_16_50_9]|nr:MAG: hypothetical protein A2144_07730 [Chloroflexi bacterium RBG_16_50_9]
MESAKKGVNIQISDKAAAFIKSRRLINPVILVNFGFRSSGGDGCGGGGGCGEGDSGSKVAYLNAIIVDGGNPGADFVKIDTGAGVPVYLAKMVYDKARQSGNTLTVTLKGLVMKKLSLEGLDMTS